VVGVAAPDFVGTEPRIPDLWMPLAMQSEIMPDSQPRDFRSAADLSWLNTMGRLKPGVTAARAHADLAVWAAQLDATYPGRITEVNITPGTFLSDPEARTIVLIAGSLVMATVSLVLLVACANVANLPLARAAVRQKEIAVRLSMGATRGRLIRQFPTESSFLALLGGGLGLLLAGWALKAGYAIVASRTTMPRVDLSLDDNVLWYTLLLSVAASLLFGLAPALHATSPDLASALKDESALLGSRVSKARLRNAPIAAQMAACMVLLLGAGLLVRGLANVGALNAGLQLGNTYVISPDTRAASFYRQLVGQIGARPGGRSALTVNPPFGGVMMTNVTREGASEDGQWGESNFNAVSADYFGVMGIGMTRGRAFTVAEAVRGDAVAVISEAMARTYWNGRDALGQRFTYGTREAPQATIQVIGVARDVRSVHIWETDGPRFYLAANPNQPNLSVIAKSAAEGLMSHRELREVARGIDPAVLVSVHTLAESVEHEAGPVRVLASLAALLGGLALALATVGIDGVMSYSVSQRTREIGIRMTLGAERRNVLRLMLADSMRPVFLGMAAGMAVAAATSRILSRLLLGVSPLDPIAFARRGRVFCGRGSIGQLSSRAPRH